MITASVASPQITASASGGNISATVGSSSVQASAGGGIGPQGPQGPQGLTALSLASDVQFDAVSDGDLLRFEQSRWRNYREESLVDGGNW